MFSQNEVEVKEWWLQKGKKTNSELDDWCWGSSFSCHSVGAELYGPADLSTRPCDFCLGGNWISPNAFHICRERFRGFVFVWSCACVVGESRRRSRVVASLATCFLKFCLLSFSSINPWLMINIAFCNLLNREPGKLILLYFLTQH